MKRVLAWLRPHPLTRKRWRRFRSFRRAWVAFVTLTVLYAVSLCAELLCNDRPLYVRYEGRRFYPAFRFVPEDTFLDNGVMTRPDYKALAESPRFASGSGNRMLFAPFPYGPHEIVRPERLDLPDQVTVVLRPEPAVWTVEITPEWRVSRVLGSTGGGEWAGPAADAVWPAEYPLPPAARDAVARRFANMPDPAFEIGLVSPGDGRPRLRLTAPAFQSRAQPPRQVRLTLRESTDVTQTAMRLVYRCDGTLESGPAPGQPARSTDATATLAALARRRFESAAVEPVNLTLGGRAWRATPERAEVRYPFPPTRRHPFGLDSSGRDVLARMLYGCRTSLTFGLLLTLGAMATGTLIGALQGYLGGWVDLLGQRAIEIWEALPFLYVLILLGSVYGRGFGLLLVAYGLFNWVGISYYMRAEMLRLRRLPYVEAARCLGLSPARIMTRHLLPNALVPLITFFPFSLVGAIGSLAALDYLGFGLPPPAPSWGELLAQAQEFGRAWWLSLYPALGLFGVMLLVVFVGEGVREAFDPRTAHRLE